MQHAQHTMVANHISVCAVLCAFGIVQYGAPAHAQQLIDRVLARVGTAAVTMTDVAAAVGFGVVEVGPGEDGDAVGLQRTIDRQLLLDEVARFSPPEPSSAVIDAEVAAMKARAGPRVESLMASTGVDERKLRQMARDTLRIRAYTAQRFGTTTQVSEDEARRYYDAHPEAFTRDGVRLSFEEAESTARERASTERLRATIEQWIRDLRMRAEVVVVGEQSPAR